MATRQSRRSKYRNTSGQEPQNQQTRPTPQRPTNTNNALVLTKDRLERVTAWDVYFNQRHKAEAENPPWPARVQYQGPPNISVPAECHPNEKPQQTPLCLWHYSEPSLDGKYHEYKLFD